MINKIKKTLLGLAAMALFAAPIIAPVYVSAAFDCDGIKDCVGGGVDETDPNSQGIDAEGKVSEITEQVINIFSWIVGIVSVIMVIVGGFQYVTSGGDSGKVTSAKNTIMYALIGIVIVALAQVMVKFVLGKFIN
jgi:hypothetical protein